MDTSESTTCVSSTSPLPSVGTQPAQGREVVESALSRFKATLSDKQLSEFRNTTYDDVEREILQIQSKQEVNKNMVHLARLQIVFEVLPRFENAIEVLFNTADLVAFTWGPIKFLLSVRKFSPYLPRFFFHVGTFCVELQYHYYLSHRSLNDELM